MCHAQFHFKVVLRHIQRLNDDRWTKTIIEWRPRHDAFRSRGRPPTMTTSTGEITIIIGDFNAKIGRGVEGDSIGAYGLGERNGRGDRLVQFCVENNLLIANTFFKQHPRRLYTWRSPADREKKIVRNQIDFILLGLSFKRYMKSTRTYPGADIGSDHNPVVLDFRLKRFLRVKREKTAKKIDIALLNNPEKKKEISSKIEKELEMVEVPVREEDVEKTWNYLRTRITNIQEKDIGFTATNKKQEWMTKEILDLMDDRRKQKANPIEYKRLNGIIRKKCREEKEIWMSTKCQEIEQLQAKHRKYQETILRNDNNEIILGVKAKLVRWKEYIETLFNDDSPCFPPPIDHILNEKAPAITKDEVVHAIKAQKSGKATGPDKINVEILKLIADNESRSLDLVTALFNKLYSSSKIPSDWLKSTFVTLPKKPNA
ncbi:uncharacterized protein LOC115875286 [Sitophilus oryzae]|uniref:Uncharacterized protein LOC115875286 n=1 Tax=Sitophilus oryzae TaxID=7048 RepID=A0A6J2X6P3_SITOR|nr:uncharacterized protein LOC115875286 [Sitophilus oryzae]